MPIKDRSLYPSDWKQISHRIRFERAKSRCEGSPAYPDCQAEHGQPHPVTGSKVVLTVAHLDHNPTNCDEDNLRAMCQRCHLNYDAQLHAQNRRKRKSLIKHYSQPRLFNWSE